MSVVIKTNVGDMTFVLHAKECPKAAYNFLALSASGYYNGTKFHRNVPKFLVQGGDPTGTGRGGDSVFASRYFDDEGFGSTFHATRGVLSMAKKGIKPNTNASQFFIIYQPQPQLDGTYTAFGQLTAGQDVLNQIEASGESEIVIEDVTVISNPFADGTLSSPII